MLFCLFVKNFAENNVLVDNVICIAFIDKLCFYLNVYIRAPKNSLDRDILSGFCPLFPVKIT